MRCPLRSPRHGSCRSRGPSRALNRAPWRCCGFGCRGGGDAHASEPDLAEALQLRDVLLLGRDALVAVVAVRVVGEGLPAALTARSQISRSGATGRTNPCMPGRQAVLDRRARRHAPRAAVWGARTPNDQRTFSRESRRDWAVAKGDEERPAMRVAAIAMRDERLAARVRVGASR